MAVPPFPDGPQRVLGETRQRFVATFVAQCDSIDALIVRAAEAGPDGTLAELRMVIHRLSGLAGTIGFPTISARSTDLERLVESRGEGTFAVAGAREALENIRHAFVRDLASPLVLDPPLPAIGPGATILIVEDDADLRAIVTAHLESAGFTAIPVVSGDRVIEAARARKPSVILLDIAMPGLDGYAVCRLLKADPDLHAVPVVFMTASANLDDKLAGLTLGADEFLTKPVDMRELTLRIQLLLRRCGTSLGPAPEVRTRTRTIVLAEDDPDVTRIVDAQARAAGYKTVVAVDGEQALSAISAHETDLMVLDLMMPKLNGFDVLSRLATSTARPKIIVLSGRGREQDVVRAFEMGADDYMTKPFNPQELMARIARMLR